MYDFYLELDMAAGMYECFTDDYVLGLYPTPKDAPFSDIEPLDLEIRLSSAPYYHLYQLSLRVYD